MTSMTAVSSNTIQSTKPAEPQVEVVFTPQPPRIIREEKKPSFIEENRTIMIIIGAELALLLLIAGIFLQRR